MQRRVIVTVLVLVGCGDDVGQHGDAAVDAATDAPPPALLPSAPDATHFMWPGVQEAFHRTDGTTCAGRVTAALNDRAVCYLGADDDVHCAGSVYTHAYGMSFVAIGHPGVDQIVLTPTFNSATGNAICVHELAGTVHCMGDSNSNGAFADGTTSPSDTFVQWSSLATVTRMGAGIDPRCVLDAAGEVYCAGYGIGAVATREDTGGGHHSVAHDQLGQLVFDDPTVFRESSVSPCWIGADGMHCSAPMLQALSGTPGDVVDGLASAPTGGLAMGDPLACWLDTSGRVFCGASGIKEQRFTSAPPILLIAGSLYTDARCAVANDGSLWCSGSNMFGELGTGSTTPLTNETMVQPPGSVKIVCE